MIKTSISSLQWQDNTESFNILTTASWIKCSEECSSDANCQVFSTLKILNHICKKQFVKIYRFINLRTFCSIMHNYKCIINLFRDLLSYLMQVGANSSVVTRTTFSHLFNPWPNIQILCLVIQHAVSYYRQFLI